MTNISWGRGVGQRCVSGRVALVFVVGWFATTFVCVCVCVCSCLFMKFTHSVVCSGRGGVVERVWAHPWGEG